MKKTIQQIALLFCFLLLLGIPNKANASHILGNELTYTCLGNNQYNVELILYADCAGITLGANQVVNFSSTSCSNNFNATLSTVAGFPVEVTPLCPTASSTCNGGSNFGVRKHVYSSIVTLPTSCPDWEISWTSCCRSGAISNITNAMATSLYANTTLNSTLSVCNNTPSFIDTQPHFTACMNDTTYLNFGAYDFDGDSLVYSLVSGQGSGGSAISYASPYTAQSPFSGTTLIDSETGLVTLVPNLVQTGLIVVKVEEYKNGAKVGEVLRELTIAISNCSANSAPKITSISSVTPSAGIAAFSTSPGVAFSMNVATYDAEVAAGTQTLTTSWNNLPNGATTTTGASPTLSWTPTASDIGTHYVYLTLSDDACPLMRSNTYAIKISVGGPAINNTPIPVDDYYTTNSFNTVSFDVLLNDSDPDGNNISLSSLIPVSSLMGTISMNGNQVDFTPGGFGSVDTFDYIICDDGIPSLCDTGRVYIFVDYPINNAVTANIAAGATQTICFDTTGLTSIGSISLNGNSFNNATILNYDLINGCVTIKADSIATDSTTFLICENTTGICVYNTIVLNVEQGVWPGDTDTSQYVDNFDLLNIGIAYGNTGTPRSPASIVWDGYLTPDWTKVTPVSNINFKHIDCNGDGIVDVQDTVAISANWNSSYTYNKSGGGSIPLYVEPITPNSLNASLPIMLGNSTIPANDIYGIAFTITYDTALIEPHTIDISIDTSWLGTAWTDLIKIHKDFYNDGMVQVAITRTDGINASGTGRIGDLIFTIQDDIMQRGVLKFPFEIINVKAIDANELEILTNPMQTEIDVIASNTNQFYLGQFVNVFPNPVSNVLNIQTEDLIIEQITLTNVAGQVVKTEIVNNNQCELYMQNLPNGIYTLSILTDKGLIHKKINILK